MKHEYYVATYYDPTAQRFRYQPYRCRADVVLKPPLDVPKEWILARIAERDSGDVVWLNRRRN